MDLEDEQQIAPERTPYRPVSPQGNWNEAINSTADKPEGLIVIGDGRVGRSIAAAAGTNVAVEVRARAEGLDGLGGRTVLLCVPDGEIAPVASAIAKSADLPLAIGHTSGVTTLDPLAGSATGGCFSLHPLQTIPDTRSDLSGCPAAVAGSDDARVSLGFDLAESIGMRPFAIAESDRAVYHAAASIASNFLVTLEETASGLLGGIGVDRPREVLAPLVRRSLENWIERGPEALTGPIARGDQETVEHHRSALAGRRPDLTGLYEALAEQTYALAGEPE